MSDEEALTAALREHFSPEDVAGIEITASARRQNLYERDRLLNTFSRRLVGLCESPNTDRGLLVSIANFVRNLVVIEPNSQLYFFVCEVSGKRFSGWAVKDGVLWVTAGITDR